MENVHKNYDAVFKDAMVLFKDKTLDFLGLTGIAPITEPLSTEIVQVEVNSELLDLTFGLQDDRGLPLEEEVNLSYDDMLRFGGYHVDLSRTYKREFITIIFVKEPTALREIKTEQFTFSPVIIQCSDIDADERLAKLKKAVAEGKPINELELIYLPLFHSKKYTPTELFKESTALINEMKAEDSLKHKIAALSIVLASKVVEKPVLEKYIEELKRMRNVIIDVFYEAGIKDGIAIGKEESGATAREEGLEAGREEGLEAGREAAREETARKMIAKGYDLLDILELTEISVERLRELRKSVKREAV